MTAFNTGQIPSSIDTLEKLSVWVAQALNNINLQNSVYEVPNIEQPVAVVQYFSYDENGTTVWRFVSRISIKLSPDFQYGTTKIWTHAQNLSATALPTGFTS